MGVPILGHNLVALGALAAARSAQDPDNGQLGLAQGGLVNVGSLLKKTAIYLILNAYMGNSVIEFSLKLNKTFKTCNESKFIGQYTSLYKVLN